MRENFMKELQALREDVANMLDGVREQLVIAMEALLEQDIQKAKMVLELDDITDKRMLKVEEKVVELMALQSPMANDLRTLFAMSKMVTDIERIGDYCVNIATQIIQMTNEPVLRPIEDIPKMANQVLDMLDLCKQAFLTKDPSKAFRAGEMDEIVDNLYSIVYREILMKIHEDQNNINQGTRLLFIGRFLERMADHTTNVCERIIYIVSGDILEIN